MVCSVPNTRVYFLPELTRVFETPNRVFCPLWAQFEHSQNYLKYAIPPKVMFSRFEKHDGEK